MDERRKFERLSIPQSSGVYVCTPDGRRIGWLSVLGRGGFQVETEHPFKVQQRHSLVIVDDSEGIRRPVRATVRSEKGGSIGFEFAELDPDAAVEIGVIIGKYYSSQHA